MRIYSDKEPHSITEFPHGGVHRRRLNALRIVHHRDPAVRRRQPLNDGAGLISAAAIGDDDSQIDAVFFRRQFGDDSLDVVLFVEARDDDEHGP